MPKISAFIDSPNLENAIRLQGWKLDYGRFRVYLKEKYNVDKAYMFIGYMDSYKKLYDAMADYGYNLVFKPPHLWQNSKIRGNVNLELVLHAAAQMAFYDKALLVSGDGDLYCLIDLLKNRNKFLKILIPNSSAYSHLLRFHASNQMDFMNNLRGKLEYFESNNKPLQ